MDVTDIKKHLSKIEATADTEEFVQTLKDTKKTPKSKEKGEGSWSSPA